jgi:phosphate transport system substrate-binding protein
MMKNSIKILVGVTFAAGLFFVNSCSSNAPKTPVSTESPTSGKITIAVDESFTQLFDTEVFTFGKFYVDATVTPKYMPEVDVLNAFLDDSVRNIVTCRPLTKEENDFLASKQLTGRSTIVAHDAIAFIINNGNLDTLVSYNTIKDVFTGKVSKWEQFGKHNKGEIKVVFDNNKSANARYLKERLGLKSEFPKNCYAVNKNSEVLEYVKKNKNALGVISVNWISDKDDSLTNKFLKEVRVLAIGAEYDDNPYEFYRPYQAYIATKDYPFIRDVYMISRESFLGLGSGFISFVAGEKGQRIILKSGMVPATMPLRVIELNKQ